VYFLNSKNFKMKIRQFEIWIADLEPRRGTETGKVRFVLVVQTDLLNRVHPSTLVCPITSNIQKKSEILRVNIKKYTSNLKDSSDIMIDQLRAIDNRRFINKVGELPEALRTKVKENIKIILDLE
jgi:mRNA interferase MazF